MREGLRLSSYRAALFDVDGTLTDSLEMILAGLGDTFEWYSGHRPDPSAIAATMGMPLREQMRMYSIHEPTEAELQARMNYALESYLRHADLEKPFGPAIEALIQTKQAGLQVALVTSRNAREVEHLKTHFSAIEFVDTIVCADDVAHPKPAADPALLACERLGVRPQEAVFLGDSIFDLRCGQAAGMDRVAVLYGAGREDALRAEHPELTLETPEDLLAWVKSTLPEPCLDARN